MGFNPINFVIWLIVLIFVGFWVGFICASLYVIVHCLAACLEPLNEFADLLLKGAQFPRYCVNKMFS